ncbi:DUF2599 domain-containing protein [Paenarthrobacter sp. NPDC056912]|uniref:DUF2599 domain-containing protein n=1 Tax=Paenarthrobacter sp. NPDC056912 TaxID=3345965 RepID=UPI003670588B
MKLRSLLSLATVSVVAVSLVCPVSTAFAADESGSGADALSALKDLTDDATSEATEVLTGVASVATDESGGSAVDAKINDIRVVLPTHPVDPISLETSAGASIKISLPFSKEAAKADVISDGVVAYDNNNGSTTVPVVKIDGSIQIATVIEHSDAPTTYSYDVGLEPGSSLERQSDGTVSVLGPEGVRVGAFAPPWAKDANGFDVKTHYEIAGTTLIQVVEHWTAGIAYPVTADPYLGIDLIQSGRWIGATFEVVPTWWLRVNGANAAAHLTLFEEFCTRYRSACNTQLWWQLACHAQFAAWKPVWHLDTWHWQPTYWDYVTHGCN